MSKFKIIEQFPPSEPIVSMVEFKGRILLATSLQVYELKDDDVFKPLKFTVDDGVANKGTLSEKLLNKVDFNPILESDTINNAYKKMYVLYCAMYKLYERLEK